MLHRVDRFLWREAVFACRHQPWVSHTEGTSTPQTWGHSLCSPLVLTCTITFNLCGPPPLIRCHELLTLSASLTESTVSTRWRLGTPGAQRQRSGSQEAWEDQGDLHSPRSLLTLFFWRWPIKCHLISGHEPKIWRHKESAEETEAGQVWTYQRV